MNITDFNVGKIVKQCRKRAELSQEDLADLLHVSQSTISRIEKNIIDCETKFFFKIAQTTNSLDFALSSIVSMETIVQLSSLVPTFINATQLFM